MHSSPTFTVFSVSLNTVISILSQLFLPYLIVSNLGISGFSTWLIINSFAAIVFWLEISYSEILHSDYARFPKSELMRIRKKYNAILNLFLLICTCILCAIAVFFGATFINRLGMQSNIRLFLLLLSGNIFYMMSLACSLSSRFESKFALFQVKFAFLRLIELLSCAIALQYYKNLNSVFITILIVRCLNFIYLYKVSNLHIRQNSDFTKLGPVIRNLWKPALGNFLNTLGNWLRIQGPILVLSLFASPSNISSFGFARTWAGGSRQLSDSVLAGYLPHLIQLRKADAESIARIKKRITSLVFFANIIFLIFSLFFSYKIIYIWSNETFSMGFLQLQIVILSLSFENLFYFKLAIARSTNTQLSNSIALVKIGILTLPIALIVGKAFEFSGFITVVFVSSLILGFQRPRPSTGE